MSSFSVDAANGPNGETGRGHSKPTLGGIGFSITSILDGRKAEEPKDEPDDQSDHDDDEVKVEDESDDGSNSEGVKQEDDVKSEAMVKPMDLLVKRNSGESTPEDLGIIKIPAHLPTTSTAATSGPLPPPPPPGALPPHLAGALAAAAAAAAAQQQQQQQAASFSALAASDYAALLCRPPPPGVPTGLPGLPGYPGFFPANLLAARLGGKRSISGLFWHPNWRELGRFAPPARHRH